MITIDEPPTVTACASCPAPLTWLYSARRNAWVSFIPVDELTLRVHGCRELQEPATWKTLRRVDPETVHRGAERVRQQLKTGTGEDM